MSDSHNESETMVEDKPEASTRRNILNTCYSLAIWCAWIVWTVLTVGIVAYLCFGFLMLYSTEAKMEVIFANRIRTPWFANYSACKDFGVLSCENVFIDGHVGKLGAWFISPASKQYITSEAYILYLHGNTGTRALDHRVQLYKVLSKMGYHILAIDYRGFGDSDGWPTEQGLVEDSKVAYKWLMKKADGRAVYLWGHSLGTAVAVQVAAWLNSKQSRLNGVILEAAFNNMTDGIKYSPLAAPAALFIPNFEQYIEDVKYVFRSTHWIKKVTSPVIMFHDKSDHIINHELGRKLYLAAKSTGIANVNIFEFDEGLYHNDIYKGKNFKPLLREFMRNTS